MVAPNTYGDASQKAAKQVLSSFFGTIATASLILVGSSAAFNIAGKQIVKSNKKRLGKKCTLCDGLRFISCGTCKGKGAIEWQPIKNPEMERVCVSDLFGDEDEQVFEMRWRWLFVGSW